MNIEAQVRKSKEDLKNLYIGKDISVKKSWWFRLTKKRWIEDWRELNTTQKAIMLTLWLYAGKRDVCYPSERKIASDLSISLKTIWRNIKVLNSKGYINITKEIGQKGKYNRYQLLK